MAVRKSSLSAKEEAAKASIKPVAMSKPESSDGFDAVDPYYPISDYIKRIRSPLERRILDTLGDGSLETSGRVFKQADGLSGYSNALAMRIGAVHNGILSSILEPPSVQPSNKDSLLPRFHDRLSEIDVAIAYIGGVVDSIALAVFGESLLDYASEDTAVVNLFERVYNVLEASQRVKTAMLDLLSRVNPQAYETMELAGSFCADAGFDRLFDMLRGVELNLVDIDYAFAIISHAFGADPSVSI